jgi:hypothetical protein
MVTGATRLRLVAIAGVFVILSSVGAYKLHRQFPRNWATVLVGPGKGSESTTRDLLYGLRAVAESENIRPGSIF